MQREKAPAVCPRCGSSRTVRLLWDCVHLCGEDEKDVEAGLAVLVGPHVGWSYEPWQAIMRRRAGDLPSWACLNCDPGWTEVHQMAMQDYRWQLEKEEAVAAIQFDRAADLRDAQYRERARLVTAVGQVLGKADSAPAGPA